MGQAKQRGTFEQRQVMAKDRDAIVREMFAEGDVVAHDVRARLWQQPMTREKLATMADRSKRVVPG